MKRKKARTYYKIAICCIFAVFLLLKYLYRPYIYSHNLFDCHIADSFTDFLGGPLGVCFAQCTKKAPDTILEITVITVMALITRELLDAWAGSRGLDWPDVIAAILGGLLIYILSLVFGFKSINKYEE